MSRAPATSRPSIRRRSLQRRSERRTGQAGYTLMEMLLVLTISAIIFVPLMAWAGLAIRQQPVLQDGMMRTNSAGLLGAYLPRDIRVAGKAAISGDGSNQPWAISDCVGGRGANGSMKLVLITGGDSVEKVVYSQAASSEDPALTSMWRRTCNPATGALISSREVYKDLLSARTSVTCTSENGDRRCRQIEMTIAPRSTNQSVTIRATRRLDEASVPADLYGNPRPTAAIEILSRSASQPLVATFSGQRSAPAPGRSLAAYRWEFQGPGSVAVTGGSLTANVVRGTFATAGNYTVLLTVTDDLGLTATSYTQITTSNLVPVAAATATPSPSAIGSVVTLDGQGSSDADGTVVSYDWIVDYPSAGGVAPGLRVTPSGPQVQLTAAAIGSVSVMLVVTDAQGSQGIGFTSFSVFDPVNPTTTTIPGATTTTLPPTDPGGTGALVAVFTDADGSGATRLFDAASTTGIGSGNTATYLWEFGDGATGTAASVSHAYPNAGEYTTRLTVTTSDGRTATTARVVGVGGAPPAPVDVRHDGANVRWNAVPGARRYLVDFEFRTATDCFRQMVNQAAGAVPSPFKAIAINPCPASATASARVGTDANGSITWSGWIAIPTLNGGGG